LRIRLDLEEEVSIAEMILLIAVKKIEESQSNLRTKIEIAGTVMAMTIAMSYKIEYSNLDLAAEIFNQMREKWRTWKLIGKR